jgi:hypothetical protein
MDDQTERAGRFLQAPPGESPLALPRSAGASADTSETPPASPENVPEIHRSGPRVHVVSSPYETLRSIARQELGDPDRERELLDLNSDQIDNPNLLPQGVKVRLPEH